MNAGVGPSLGGFITFVQNVMGIPASSGFDPTSAPQVTWAYDYAIQFVNPHLQNVPGVIGAWDMYSFAVYNLAADFLINIAPDPNPSVIYQNDLPYWTWLRKMYGVLNFVPGVVSSSSDEGTSTSFDVPEQLKNLTLSNLQNLKTPYGRQYLGIAGSWGSQWGLC